MNLGDVVTILRAESAQKYFWARVNRRGENDCWEWTGSRLRLDGRGAFSRDGVRMTASRASLVMHSGQAPDSREWFACHTCDNPPCVNPSHLWWGTRSDNVRDSVEKNRKGLFSKLTCQNGHPITPENVKYYYLKDGGIKTKTCNICVQEQYKRHTAKVAAKRAHARAEKLNDAC